MVNGILLDKSDMFKIQSVISNGMGAPEYPGVSIGIYWNEFLIE